MKTGTLWTHPLSPRTFSGSFPMGVILALFVLANFLIAWSDLSIGSKAWIFLGGIGLPWALLLWSLGGENGDRLVEKEILREPPVLIVLPLLVLAFWLRLTPALSHPWPSGDEALQGFFAIDLLQGKGGRFFNTSGQHPPLLIWLLSGLLHVLNSPLLAFRVLPALFSILALLACHGACRQFFGRTHSAIFTLLMAFGYWSLLSGRWCVQGCLVPFQTMVCLFLLGRYIREPWSGSKSGWALLLGLWTGWGSLTYSSWLAVIPFITLIVLIHRPQGRSGLAHRKWSFFLGLGAALLPWTLAALREGFGGYITGVSIGSGFFTWKDQVRVLISNLTCFLWGPVKTLAVYGPVRGGLLNPVLGAFFLLGLALLMRSRRDPRTIGIFLGTVFFLAPGLLSADEVHCYRMIQFLPILLAVTALGLVHVLGLLPPPKRAWALALILVPSAGIDLSHLWKAQDPGSRLGPLTMSGRNDESRRAYGILERIQKEAGSGRIFTEFLLLARSHTLRVAAYPFNLLEDGPNQTQGAAWTGLVVNVHYVPFLSRRFPKAHWERLSSGREMDGGMALVVLPADAMDPRTLGQWTKFHTYLHGLASVSENMMNNPSLYRSVVAGLDQGYPLVEGDPFLESLYGEWSAQYRYPKGLGGNIQALQRALKQGYPSANLYLKTGNFLFLNHQKEEARKAYRAALDADPHLEAAKAMLQRLEGPLPGAP